MKKISGIVMSYIVLINKLLFTTFKSILIVTEGFDKISIVKIFNAEISLKMV